MADIKSPYMRMLSWLLIFSLINTTVGCNYYTYTREQSPSLEKLDTLKNSPSYLIVHNADQAFNLVNVRVDQQAQTITGNVVTLTADHYLFKSTKPDPGSSNRYKKKGHSPTPGVVDEVHFYLKDVDLRQGESVTFSITSIEKVDIYDPDTGATTSSHIFGGLGILVGVLALVTIIVMLTKSSCPFVYVNNGNEYVFAGEIFSGAIFKSIESDDYLLLPHIEAEQDLEITIANKLKEEQYINQLGIIHVSHPTGTKVLPDRAGMIHHIQHLEPMISATVDTHDITTQLQNFDSTYFSFNAETGDHYFNDVIITFSKPEHTSEGHLVMNIKNSLWGDYVFGEFTRLFGGSYSAWVQKQNKKSEYEKGKWAFDQGLAMKVYVESNGEWILSDTVDMVGPLSFRDLVVPLDLFRQPGETVRVKLSAGFMLWDLDYVAMDYSTDAGMEIKYIHPSTARSNKGEDALAVLKNADIDFLEQKNTGDEVTLTFPVSKGNASGIQHDFILHSRGYYNHVRDYEGTPEMTKLLSFRGEGRFSQFSWEKYDEINQILNVAEISASIK